MRLCTEDSVREYRVNREDFNILNIALLPGLRFTALKGQQSKGLLKFKFLV